MQLLSQVASAKHFWVEPKTMSQFISDGKVLSPAIEETASTAKMMSGYSFLTILPISAIGFRTPVEVSLWQTVKVSYLPLASFSATMSGLIALPISTSNNIGFFAACSQGFGQHRWEKAPLTHAKAFCFTMLRPIMSNHNVPEEVVTVGLKSAVSWKNLAILSVIPPYKSENSFSLWPIRE